MLHTMLQKICTLLWKEISNRLGVVIMWTIKNNLLCVSFDDGTDVIPTSEEIYSLVFLNKTEIKGRNVTSPKSELPLRFSKIGLNTYIEVLFSKGNIQCNVWAKKGNELFSIETVGDSYADYTIIDNTWHFISRDIEMINSVLASNLVIPQKPMTYKQYMALVRDFKEQGVDYIDKVPEAIDQIKESSEDEILLPQLKANLFPYQKSGLNWLNFMVSNGCGCLLGDEMGLGKTLQIIALFGKLKTSGKQHFLVVAPVSLLVNWQREIAKFYPSLKTIIHHGSRRTGRYTTLLEYDVVIMSYSNVQTDLSLLNMIEWDVVALDEAQNIKNPYSIRAKSVKRINHNVGVAITGTPFENHMTDVWSIVDFVLPNYLGSLSSYEAKFSDTVADAISLEKYLSPIMIRRRVHDVAKDLPERVDIPQAIPMTDEEASFYEDERTGIRANLSVLSIDKMQKLRMFCTHPKVYNQGIELQDPTLVSNKYSRMCDILEEIFANNEKVILFTSFNKMFDILCDDIPKRFGVSVDIINGSTPPALRQTIVDDFAKIMGSAMLILNPKAAGTGLNITCANHVIHYNLEWNPAIEDQASARAYRRGQTKTVFVHRLYYSNTIEEVINDRIQRKRDIFNNAVIGNDGNLDDHADLIRALNISPCGGSEND